MNLPDRLAAGLPYPLGATYDGEGVNFAVFSANATRMELCLYDEDGGREIGRYDLPEWTDEIWHGYLPGAEPGTVYGLRAHGPYEPEKGHRFNPNKLLLDPYAKRLVGELKWDPSLFGYVNEDQDKKDLSFDERDSAAFMPKAVVAASSFDWTGDTAPRTAWSDTVIYEVHVKGLTKLLEDAGAEARGTFAALAHPKVIEHLKRLGVTAVELLPIHAFVQDSRLEEMGLRNYWGYNTLGFFTPERAYLQSGEIDEVKRAVKALHEAGLEVILDVVYNHTAEGSELGPTLSFRGLDNFAYYRSLADDPRYLVNDTGTGNTVNTSHTRVLQMIADSLRYWASEFHVDGFRFDLGCTLGREPYGFDPGSGFFDILRTDPVLTRLKLISEPWDCGPGGYQLGQHPPGFAEWNDKFRDTTRKFWRGDAGERGAMAERLAGSGDLFDRRARRPWASVNFITAHDGFTLNDLVSYNDRHNEANGEDNKDGSSDNNSDNWGEEGPSENEGIKAVRGRVQRAMLTTLFASLGTPMLLGGDEFGRTQDGNNNAYCQDDEISWFDWKALESDGGRALTDFTAKLIRIRRKYEVLHSRQFLYGQEKVLPGVLDLDWFDERAGKLSSDDWGNSEGRALVMRRARRREDGTAEIVTLLLNAGPETLTFTLPEPATFERRLLIDSNDPTVEERELEAGETIDVADHSALLFIGVASAMVVGADAG